jgi:hypothetical protein
VILLARLGDEHRDLGGVFLGLDWGDERKVVEGMGNRR